MARDQRERGNSRSTMDYYEYKRMRELRRMQSATNVENPTARQNINRMPEVEENEPQPSQKKSVDKLLGGIKDVISGAVQRAPGEKYEDEPFTMDETAAPDASGEMDVQPAEEQDEEAEEQGAVPFASAMNMARKLGGGIKSLAGKARAMRQRQDDRDELELLNELENLVETPVREAEHEQTDAPQESFSSHAQPVSAEPEQAAPEAIPEEAPVDIAPPPADIPAPRPERDNQEPEGVFSLEDEDGKEAKTPLDGLKKSPVMKKIGGFFKFLAKGELEDGQDEEEEYDEEDEGDEEEAEQDAPAAPGRFNRWMEKMKRGAEQEDEDEDWDDEPSEDQEEPSEFEETAEPASAAPAQQSETAPVQAEDGEAARPQTPESIHEIQEDEGGAAETAAPDQPVDREPDQLTSQTGPVLEDAPVEKETPSVPSKSDRQAVCGDAEDEAGEDGEEDDLYFDEDEDEEEGELFNPFGWIKDKLSSARKGRAESRKIPIVQDEDEDDGDFEDDIDFEGQPSAPSQDTTARGSRFVAVDGPIQGMDGSEQRKTAPEARQDKGGSQMEGNNRKPSMTELLAADLDDQPVMSRRARRRQAMEEETAQADVAQPVEESEFPVDEPTVEFKPIRSRPAESAPARPAPGKKRPPRVVEVEEEEDDEEEEEIEEARKSVRRPAQPKRPSRPQGKKRRVYSDEDYDGEYDDDYDDYDDDDYDDDYDDDDRGGFGKHFLGFLKVLVVIVLILALSVLALQQLEANGRVNLNWLRNTVGAVLPVEKVFPDPAQPSVAPSPEAAPTPEVTVPPVEQQPAGQQPAADPAGDAAAQPDGQQPPQ